MKELNHADYLFVKNILLPTRYIFTLLAIHWKKVNYQLWIFLDQVSMQLIIVLQVLLKKKEEYSFLKARLPQRQPSNVYKSFDEFKLRIKILALNKLWEINIQEQLVKAPFTSSEYVLPTYEIYIDNLLNFMHVFIHGFFQLTICYIYYTIVLF